MGVREPLAFRVSFISWITTQTLHAAVFGDSGREEEACSCRASKPRTQSALAQINPGSHKLSSHLGLVLAREGSFGKDIEVTLHLGKLHWDLFYLLLSSNHQRQVGQGSSGQHFIWRTPLLRMQICTMGQSGVEGWEQTPLTEPSLLQPL